MSWITKQKPFKRVATERTFWWPVGLEESLDFHVINVPQRTKQAALDVVSNLPPNFWFSEASAVKAATHSSAVNKARTVASREARHYEMPRPTHLKALRRSRRK